MKKILKPARTAARKYKKQLGDSAFSILGLVLMNAVAQIAVYPLLARRLGTAGYGQMQYLLAYVNIITVSVGCATGLARMTAPAGEREQDNGDYHLFLLAVCLLGIPFVWLIRRFGGVSLTQRTAFWYYILFVAMAFRYYADVAFKLTLNYRGYFLYYLMISVGYAGGVFLFLRTGVWPLALVPGELSGVAFAFLYGNTLRRRALLPTKSFPRVFRVILLLCLSEGISNLIFNADRLLLKWLIDDCAVTVYYLATLVGKTMSLVSTPLCGVLMGYLARYEGGFGRRGMKKITLAALAAVPVFTGLCVLGGFLMLLLLYPGERVAVTPYLWVGSLSQVLFFTAGILCVILLRFAKKSFQVLINGVFGVCFLAFGIPATVLFGLWGFALAMVAANLVRFLLALLLGFYCAAHPAPEEELPPCEKGAS